MKYLYTVLFLCYFSMLSFSNGNITVTIVDSVKAAEFNQNYKLVLPVQSFKHMLKIETPDKNQKDTSKIFTTTVYKDQYISINVPREKEGTGLNAVWMTPLSFDTTGFIYFNNGNITNYKYRTGALKTFTLGNEFPFNTDMHNIVNEGDSIYYYATTEDKKKRIKGRDTLIVDFEFYKWNEKTNTTTRLFTASEIVPDSLLNPRLFEAGNNPLYDALDIYHWNWMEKTGPNKLLVNFAFCGFMQIDILTKTIDWYWGHNGHSFSKITGVGDLSNPFYTHCVRKIKVGPLAGAYSYFENGAITNSADSCTRPARGRIFRIDEADNSINIISEIRFDSTAEKTPDIPSMALGSVHVLGNYKLINLGMMLPIQKIMRIKNMYGMDSAVTFWKHWQHPSVYLYDLDDHEIAHYTFPYGEYCYTAWIKVRTPVASTMRAPTYVTFDKGKEPRIYPNPVDEELHLSIVADELDIIDADGDFMKKVNNTDKVYTGDLPPGEYYINIFKSNSKTSRKFIKN